MLDSLIADKNLIIENLLGRNDSLQARDSLINVEVLKIDEQLEHIREKYGRRIAAIDTLPVAGLRKFLADELSQD